MELTDFFVILLILILIGLIFYFGFVSTSPVIVTQTQKQEEKQEYELQLPYPTNHSMYPNDMNVNNNPSYQNEVIVQDEYLKEGDYTKQFKEIDMNNIPKPNTNIGFNPEAKEDSKQLPFADVHINYLLNN